MSCLRSAAKERAVRVHGMGDGSICHQRQQERSEITSFLAWCSIDRLELRCCDETGEPGTRSRSSTLRQVLSASRIAHANAPWARWVRREGTKKLIRLWSEPQWLHSEQFICLIKRIKNNKRVLQFDILAETQVLFWASALLVSTLVNTTNVIEIRVF